MTRATQLPPDIQAYLERSFEGRCALAADLWISPPQVATIREALRSEVWEQRKQAGRQLTADRKAAWSHARRKP